MIVGGWKTAAHKWDTVAGRFRWAYHVVRGLILDGWNTVAVTAGKFGWVYSVVQGLNLGGRNIAGKFGWVYPAVHTKESVPFLTQEQPVSVGYSVGWPQFYPVNL